MPGEEVIYLSSDEEESSEDLPRKNLVDCDSSPLKMLSSQVTKSKNSEGKRKAPDQNAAAKKMKVDLTGVWLDSKAKPANGSKESIKEISSACKSTDKKQKAESGDELCLPSTSNGLLSSEPSTSTASEENLRKIKPTLVVKAKEPISVENKNEEVFLMFISQCLCRERTSDMQKTVEKLKRKYEQLDADYANSPAFADLLNEKRNLLMQKQGVLWTHIKEVLDEMKARKASGCKNENVGNLNGDFSAVADALEAERKKFRKQELQIRKIEQVMDLIQRRIKKYEEAEVDWDDEDDSMYMKLERYKKRMIELYNTWCKLTDNHEDAGRSYLRPKHIKLTDIPNVDKAINSFVNSKRSSLSASTKEADFFPDYIDIFNLIHTYNVQEKLELDKRTESATAKQAFIRLGEHLKKERQQDYYDTFSLWYEDQEDPAKNNPELRSQLEENREQGEKKLNEIFEEFTKRQEELGANSKSTEVNETDDDNDENEEEEEEDEGDDERDVTDAEVVDIESNSDASNPEVDKENGMKNTENGAVRIEEKLEEEKELEIIETETPSQRKSNEGVEENSPGTSKQAASSTPTSVNNSASDSDDDEADDKPLLKLRSFAKPPCFWVNSQEIKDSDSSENSSSKNKKEDDSIEIIDLDATEENSIAKKIQPIGTLPGGKIIKRIVPVSAANVRRLNSGNPLRDPVAASTLNQGQVPHIRIVPMATSTPIRNQVEARQPAGDKNHGSDNCNLSNIGSKRQNCVNPVSNGHPKVTITSTQTGKNYVNVNNIRLANSHPNNVNRNNNAASSRQTNLNLNRNSGNLGAERVLNPLAVSQNIPIIHRAEINSSSSNKPPRSKGPLS